MSEEKQEQGLDKIADDERFVDIKSYGTNHAKGQVAKKLTGNKKIGAHVSELALTRREPKKKKGMPSLHMCISRVWKGFASPHCQAWLMTVQLHQMQVQD